MNLMQYTTDQKRRIELLVMYISAERPTNRSFDSCLEHGDGDAIVIALYERILKRPKTKFAKNIWKYLCKYSVLNAYSKHIQRGEIY